MDAAAKGHRMGECAMSEPPNRREWVLAALEQYEPRLLRNAQRLLGDEGHARDVVQFVFLRLCDESPAAIDKRLAQWLYTVCRNRALDVLRANGREGVAALDSAVAVGRAANHGSPASIIEPPSREIDPADSAERSELHACLRLLVERLPASQREAIDLWAEGFSYVEISRIVDRHEGHIRVLVHRGLKTLREHPQVRALMAEDFEVVPPPRPVRNALRGVP
jgi:RNA polymerase sigma factor (sigma-70 family)